MRPFIDPSTEPLTVIMSGVTDNRFFRQQQTRQYSISAPLSNLNELVRTRTGNTSCTGSLSTDDLLINVACFEVQSTLSDSLL
jgi:hypothetical protein